MGTDLHKDCNSQTIPQEMSPAILIAGGYDEKQGNEQDVVPAHYGILILNPERKRQYQFQITRQRTVAKQHKNASSSNRRGEPSHPKIWQVQTISGTQQEDHKGGVPS